MSLPKSISVQVYLIGVDEKLLPGTVHLVNFHCDTLVGFFFFGLESCTLREQQRFHLADDRLMMRFATKKVFSSAAHMKCWLRVTTALSFLICETFQNVQNVQERPLAPPLWPGIVRPQLGTRYQHFVVDVLSRALLAGREDN